MRALLIVVVLARVALAAQQAAPPQVTPQESADGLKDPTKWLTYSGDYNGHRHSPLTQITPENVHQLTAQWTFQTGTLGSFQTTPIVIDGVIYVTGFNNNAWAIDARSGRTIWRYRRISRTDCTCCCGAVNRGFGVLGDRLFMTTIDAHLLALDMKTGGVLYDVELDDYKRRLLGDRRAAGRERQGDHRHRRSRVRHSRLHRRVRRADRQARMALLHRRRTGRSGGKTWPQGDAYQRGGGSIWVTGTYDPEQNLVFFGTGNPGPTTTATSARATTSTPRRSSRSTPTPASCAGIISSRRTTCTTGTRRRCRCSAT